MRMRAVREGDDYIITGAKAWTTHGGRADFYTVVARTSDQKGKGISCFLVPACSPGLTADKPEDKTGLSGVDHGHHALRRRAGSGRASSRRRGAGAPARLGRPRLRAPGNRRRGHWSGPGGAGRGGALRRRARGVGQGVIRHQGLAFLLADMPAAVESASATYLHAARLKEAGRPFSKAASIAKLIATDNAMRVTTVAVQVLGGVGYTKDFPVERYMREVKVMQIFEGTNQIQRVVISRALAQ
jgi:hypothetical protein